MIFKEPHMKDQLSKTPLLLQKLVDEFCELSEEFGVEPVVTRVSDAVEGESGVHPDYRAVDFRNEHDGKFLYSKEQIEKICDFFNQKFARRDDRPTILHHSFRGMPFHFHLQVARTQLEYRDQFEVQQLLRQS